MKNWNRFFVRALSMGLAGSMIISTPAFASTDSVGLAGVSAVLNSSAADEETMAAGGVATVSLDAEALMNARNVLADETVEYQPTEEETEAQKELAEQVEESKEEKEEESPYKNIAISQVSSYVNIRSGASEDDEVVGKIYNNAAATILDTVETDDGTWYKVESGNVTGYTKAKYFATGEEAEAIAYEVGDVKATVNTETLRLRSEASLDSSTVTLLSGEEKYEVISEENGFTKIRIDDDVTGYVASEYVDYSVTFQKAVTLEEEQEAEEAKAAAEAASEEAAAEEAESNTEAAENDDDEEDTTTAKSDDDDEDDDDKDDDDKDDEDDESETKKKKKKETTTEKETEKKTTEEETEKKTTEEETEKKTTEEETEKKSEKKTTEDEDDDDDDDSYNSDREAIVDYALSFVGNLRYVYGGNSLKTGVDCSGFVQQVFKHFGYSLPRTSSSQGSYGRKVSSSKKQPGDIIYYGGHVAIYIGNGEVVHASNAKTGIKVSRWNYRSVKSIRNVLD